MDTSPDPSFASQQASIALDRAWAVTRTKQPPLPPPPSKKTKPTLPPISEARRHSSLTEHAVEDPSIALREIENASSKEKTYLYLAYGSNLAASTFQGTRGIRPLAALNVVVPELVMTFDLPGFPYSEPCFANTSYRSTPPPPSTKITSDNEKAPLLPQRCSNPHWDKGLVGVVYEVTATDFAHILATEGGGAAYHDVLVTCHPLDPNDQTVPPHPSTPPFKSHTLYAPPPPPGERGSYRHRPIPGYAQPSKRYLGLLSTGAEEHDIPEEYRTYLGSLQPYTITTQRQRLGKLVFSLTWRPIVTALFVLSRMLSSRHGQSPKWLATLLGAVFTGVWITYDWWMKGVFGDGERTIEEREGKTETQSLLPWNRLKDRRRDQISLTQWYLPHSPTAPFALLLDVDEELVEDDDGVGDILTRPVTFAPTFGHDPISPVLDAAATLDVGDGLGLDVVPAAAPGWTATPPTAAPPKLSMISSTKAIPLGLDGLLAFVVVPLLVGD
ncbi:MAG: hypothetical protein Q9218_001131 [Villophora microphyllina]